MEHQQEYFKWIAISSSEIFLTGIKPMLPASCIGMLILYHWVTWKWPVVEWWIHCFHCKNFFDEKYSSLSRCLTLLVKYHTAGLEMQAFCSNYRFWALHSSSEEMVSFWCVLCFLNPSSGSLLIILGPCWMFFEDLPASRSLQLISFVFGTGFWFWLCFYSCFRSFMTISRSPVQIIVLVIDSFSAFNFWNLTLFGRLLKPHSYILISAGGRLVCGYSRY